LKCRSSRFLIGTIISVSAWAQTPPAAPAPEVAPPPAAPAPPPLNTKVDSSGRRQLTDEEIQNQFFKKRQTPEVSQVFLPIFYEKMERAITRIKSRIKKDDLNGGTLEVDGEAMIAVLEDLAVPEWTKKFEAQKKSCVEQKKSAGSEGVCWVPFSMFPDSDVEIKFDERALEIRVHVPPQLRTPKTSSLFKIGSNDLDDVTNKPSWFSSYVNVNMNQMFRSDDTVYKGGREPLAGQLDSGTRFGPMVVEAYGRYMEQRTEEPSPDPMLVREDVRAVFDLPNSLLRSQVGDLLYPVRGFQTYRPMAGASVFTQFSLQPSLLTLPGGNYEIFLTRPSKVMVFINEQLTQILDLPAGRHNLRDFPFNSGMNDLRLEIMDDSGRTDTQTFSFFSNSELLKTGMSELSYSVGVPWTEDSGVRNYDSHDTTISIFHRHGFSEHWTLGYNVQHDPFQTIAGLESLFSTKYGYFGFEPASSTAPGRSAGYAARLRYVLQEYIGQEKASRFTTMEGDFYSDAWAPLGIPNQINTTSFRVLGTHTRAISKRTSLNFNLDYEFNRRTAPLITDSYGAGIGVNRRWGEGLSTNFNVRHARTNSGSEDISVMMFLIWALPKDKQFVTASLDSASNAYRADWTYQPSAGVDGFTAQANVQSNNTIGKSYGGMLDYIGNRARLNATEDVAIPPTQDPNQSGTTTPQTASSIKTTNLRLGTALVFAGGHLSISRPVTDSFAMLVPLKNLEGQDVHVNPQLDGTYAAETGWLGPAVDPEIPSYSTTPLSIDQKNLKTGTSIPHDHFMIKPPYHGGYAIEIGSDATIYLTLKLEKADGSPADMIAGQAIYLDDTSKEAVTVFTNRSGLLRSEGFRPGHYRIEISDEWAPVEFTIPSSAGESYDAGTLRLKARGK